MPGGRGAGAALPAAPAQCALVRACVRACVRAFVPACLRVRACARACVHARVRACVRARARVRACISLPFWLKPFWPGCARPDRLGAARRALDGWRRSRWRPRTARRPRVRRGRRRRQWPPLPRRPRRPVLRRGSGCGHRCRRNRCRGRSGRGRRSYPPLPRGNPAGPLEAGDEAGLRDLCVAELKHDRARLGAVRLLGPLGLCRDGNVASFTRRPSVEVKHGRASLLAALGYTPRTSSGSSRATCRPRRA